MPRQGNLFRLNIPILQPEETLYSWFGYIHLANAHASVLDTSIILTGSRYAALQHDFPGFLGQVLENAALDPGIAPELALKHTMLGFFLPFRDEVFCSTTLETVTQNKSPHLKYRLGIPASGIGGEHPLKLCQQCVEEDQKNIGRAYWHAKHQPPSVLLCQEHQNPLRTLVTHNTPVHLREWLFPTMEDVRLQEFGDIKRSKPLIRLSTFTEHLLQEPAARFDPEVITLTYRERLKERGEITANGSVRLKALKPAFESYFHDCLNIPSFEIVTSLKNEQSGFLGSLVRSRPKPAHPFKHLLLISFLFESWTDFVNSYDESEKQKEELADLPPAEAPKSTNQHVEDPRREAFLGLVSIGGSSVRAAAIEVGVSINTAIVWAKQAGIEFTPRSKTFGKQALKVIEEDLKQGHDKQTIVEKHSISIPSLNRILRSDPNLKQQWSDAQFKKLRDSYRKSFSLLVAKYPGVAVKQLRKIPGNGYLWLYRHDREWLIEHLPSLWMPRNQ